VYIAVDIAKDGDRVTVNCVAIVRCGMAMWRLHFVRLAPPLLSAGQGLLCVALESKRASYLECRTSKSMSDLFEFLVEFQ
jgi:hypothetical protein